MDIVEIKKWFELAVPEPTDKHRAIQIACHYEECGEMAEALNDFSLLTALDRYSDYYKSDKCESFNVQLDDDDRIDLLDSLCDQIVTAIGVAHMFGFDIEGALKEVNRSNFSKFVDGKPIFNEQGKIKKGENYSAPDLLPFMSEKS